MVSVLSVCLPSTSRVCFLLLNEEEKNDPLVFVNNIVLSVDFFD